jgi:hypothetical protein
LIFDLQVQHEKIKINCFEFAAALSGLLWSLFENVIVIII